MEAMVKKYRQKFRKVKELMDQWDQLHSLLISQLGNASSIIARLPLLQDLSNYGSLDSVGGIQDVVLRKQILSLQTILHSMNKTIVELHGIVVSMERFCREGHQLVKGGSSSSRPTLKQLQQRVGVKPCLADCVDGLVILHDMHHAEYLLKCSLVSALSTLALKHGSSDLGTVKQLLVDQPNIPKDEVQLIFDIIFAEEMC